MKVLSGVKLWAAREKFAVGANMAVVVAMLLIEYHQYGLLQQVVDVVAQQQQRCRCVS